MRVRMHTSKRVLFLTGSVLVLLGGVSAARAETSNGSRCDEWSNMLGTFHQFGGGACYQGAPNGAHTNAQKGYCSQFHYTC